MMYLYGLLALIIVVLGGAVYKYRGDAIQERATAALERSRAETAISANAAQEATIGRLRATIEANEKLAAEHALEVREFNERFATLNEQLRDLVSKNAEVRDFLDIPVPDALRRLHSKPQAGNSGAKPSHP